ncbi:hypothetical protein M427DRAFT_426615 [Gonapodya prolifera JEL478]|uniref:L domain-like protein n=1 Tax=Gonapodya prolifera (strain JEL478) TaxID=1344416 RepID=A0A139A4D1_GONPJ|nr:hypothetical protein M427DRAFT_426615 [Gonapodya prolifera JEL478]|eukprot:KXS11676.1 hypothetical protein M427DRAFT_426615 [Gonapodya prolifera JEL478]
MSRVSFVPFVVALVAAVLLLNLTGPGNAAASSSNALIHTKNNITFTPGRRSLTKPLTIYIIWYGAWPDPDKAIITDYIGGLSTSDFWKINTMYYSADDTNRKHISSSVSLGPSIVDNYSLGKVIDGYNNYDISRLVYTYISQGKLPADLDGGVYLVLLDKHTIEGEYCNFGYCGFHTSVQSDFMDARNNNRTVKGIDPNFPDYAYAWIGHPKSCGYINGMASCAWHNILTSPNGNPPVDAMLPHIAHEIAESATNPDIFFPGWMTSDGNENVTYGDAKEENGYWYNAQWNGRKYLIQQHWNPTTQLCAPSVKPQISDCGKLQSLLPNFYLGDDCCNSGFADCANGVIRKLEIHTGNMTRGPLSTLLQKISVYFPELEVLQIAAMPLTGEITDAMCRLKKLQTISMFFLKNITGSLPDCLGYLKDLSILIISNNPQLTGPIPTSLTKVDAVADSSRGKQ